MKLGLICEEMKDQYGPVAFSTVAELGLDFIEVCCNFDEDSEKFISSVEETKRLVDETGIKIGSVGRWNLKANVGGKIDRAELQKNIDLLHAAHRVGAPVFVCGCNYDESVSRYVNYGAAIEYFKILTEEAKPLGIKVAVYNCGWKNFVCESHAWDIVLEEVPDLWIKYDPAHAFIRTQGYYGYIEEMMKWLPRVAHVHIKGASRHNGEYIDDPPAGMDQIDWNTVFALLYKHGYDGGLSIEPHSQVWTGELGRCGIEFTVDFVRKFILR